MRVLHLGANTASQMSVTVRALRSLGVDARGIALPGSVLLDPVGIETLSVARRDRPASWVAARVRGLGWVLPAIARADVIHWHFGAPSLPADLDLRWARLLRRRGVVEFYGSDVRLGDVVRDENPFYADAGSAYEYRTMETRRQSFTRQRTFARRGVSACLVPPTFDRYLEPGLFSQVETIGTRVWMDDYTPNFPDPSSQRPVVVHGPTAPVGKGTPAVLRAVEGLRRRGVEFEFVLLEGVPRRQALDAIRSCDVLLDQFVVGDGYGVTAVEAMAFGKPVVGYLTPALRASFPDDLPLAQATQDDLVDVLGDLLADGDRRLHLGQESRSFAEQHHDAKRTAERLVGTYGSLRAP